MSGFRVTEWGGVGRDGSLNRNWAELFNELCAGGTCQTSCKRNFLHA